MKTPSWYARVALLGVAVMLGGFEVAAGADRPNVLFIMADDLNNSLGCYNHPVVKTPNLDRLAARGVRFDVANCQYPLCGPSRNSLLTGLYPNGTGIYANSQIFRQFIPRHVSLPQAFRLSGYFSAKIGKLYHYNVPGSIGTEGHGDPASWELTLNPAGCDRLIEQPEIFSTQGRNLGSALSWYASPREGAKHTDGMISREAEWLLERFAKDDERPFFLAVGFFRPHTPYVAPKSYFKQYPEDDMPVVTGVEEDRKDIPYQAYAIQERNPEQQTLSDVHRRQAVQGYYSAISFMDTQVGRLIDALDRLDLAKNTIVVFTSDHGYHMGEHGLWQKRSLFEESARVPLVMVVPGVSEAGSVVKAPVGLVDVYPTLAELCDVAAPRRLAGQSLVPMIRNTSKNGRGWALTQVTRQVDGKQIFGYSLRTRNWRYTEWDDGREGSELYDHQNDPRELTNLVASPDQTDRVDRLSATLKKAIASTMPKSGEVPQLRKKPWAPRLPKQ